MEEEDRKEVFSGSFFFTLSPSITVINSYYLLVTTFFITCTNRNAAYWVCHLVEICKSEELDLMSLYLKVCSFCCL